MDVFLRLMVYFNHLIDAKVVIIRIKSGATNPYMGL